MNDGTREVTVRLGRGPDGNKLETPVLLYVETRSDGGEEEVSNKIVDGLQNVLDAIRALSSEIADAVRAAGPDRFSVEMGFEIKGESGGLVAVLVRAGGTATVKVTLGWEKTRAPIVAAAGAASPALPAPV